MPSSKFKLKTRPTGHLEGKTRSRSAQCRCQAQGHLRGNEEVLVHRCESNCKVGLRGIEKFHSPFSVSKENVLGTSVTAVSTLFIQISSEGVWQSNASSYLQYLILLKVDACCGHIHMWTHHLWSQWNEIVTSGIAAEWPKLGQMHLPLNAFLSCNWLQRECGMTSPGGDDAMTDVYLWPEESDNLT